MFSDATKGKTWLVGSPTEITELGHMAASLANALPHER